MQASKGGGQLCCSTVQNNWVKCESTLSISHSYTFILKSLEDILITLLKDPWIEHLGDTSRHTLMRTKDIYLKILLLAWKKGHHKELVEM